jgi:hypothetical protein
MAFDLLNFLLLTFIIVAPVVYLWWILVALKPYLVSVKKYVFIFLGFVLVYFNKLLFGGQTLAQQDFNNLQITFFSFFKESALTYKRAPIWNSYTGGGYDTFSNPLANYFSPFLWIFLVFKDIYYAANVYIVLQTFFTLLFAFIYFRIIKLSKPAAFVGSTMLTFNAFFTMRLSPGVGVEYFFALKWIVLSLGFTHLYITHKKMQFLLMLSVSLAFMFEGNMNAAVVGGLIWGIYALWLFKFKEIQLYAAPLLAGLIYSIRLLPGFYLMLTAGGRISETAQGWRVEKIDPVKLWEYFLPLAQLFQTPAFTPGLVGFVLFICGFWYFAFKYKNLETGRIFLAHILLLTLGLILVTNNPASDLIFKLPALNRLTILPAFILFLLIPLVTISALFANELVRIKRYGIFVGVISFIVFFEVLIGPPTFGAKTYSFNFLKMDYQQEMQKLEYYNFVKDFNKVGILLDDRELLLFPSFNAFHKVYLLNDFKYLYTSTLPLELTKRTNFSEAKKYADYVVATREIVKGTRLLKTLEVPRFDQGTFSNYAILDRVFLYDKLQDFRWDHTVKIYEPLSKSVVSVKKDNAHPTTHKFTSQAINYEKNGNLITSITYSPFWHASGNANIIKGKYGYLVLTSIAKNTNTTLTYINPFIYIGFFGSLISFAVISFILLQHKDEF